MARITDLFQRQRIQEDAGGTIPDDITMAIKRCHRAHTEATPMLECLERYLVFRGDLTIEGSESPIEGSPEHEYASDIAGGELA